MTEIWSKQRKTFRGMTFAVAGCLIVAGAYRAIADDQSPANSAPSTTAAPATSDTVNPKKFHALLVGCTQYDNLSPQKWLNGPANDVDLIRRFFVDHLKLSPQSIVVLSEPEATAKGPSFRPTRDNITREIQKLIDTAQADDQVVIVFGGHGGQQPEHEETDATYLKPDGMDQMFLPCDCGHWSGKHHCVENAIADYEMRNWCKQITNVKKARLWVVLDCCCSGWMLRDDSGQRPRNLNAKDLGIPEADLQKAQAAAAARRPANQSGGATRGAGGETQQPAPGFGPQSTDYVGIYAAQRDECEMEMPMPCTAEQNQSQRVQGLLSFAIVDILSHASRPITYGELADLIRQRYAQWGRTMGPTPVVEGLAQDRVVLGVKRWPGRSRRQWHKDDNGDLSLNQGSVEGLTPGSIVALYPSIDQPNAKTLLGYAKVNSCDLLQSDIKLTKYNDAAIPTKADLPSAGTFDIAWTDCGSMRVKVAVDPQPMHTNSAPRAGNTAVGNSAADDNAARETLRLLAADLKAPMAQEDSLCTLVENLKEAQWIVQMRDGKLVLLGRDAAPVREKLPPETPRFAVSADHPATDVVREMTQIARAANLVELTKVDQAGAVQDSAAGATADDSHPNVELKILHFTSKSDRHPTEFDPTKGPLNLVPGEYVGWRITNRSSFDVAVSLLYIDAGYGIKAIYPRPGSGIDNMLTRNGGSHTTRPAKITANPLGNEHIVLVAVPRKAGSQSPDFSFLEQPTLPRARGGGDDNPAIDSPLGKLLQRAMYGSGKTRGMDTGDAAQADLMLQSWTIKADSSE